MYHVLEVTIVTLLVGAALLGVLNRHARPLVRPVRRALAAVLLRAEASSLRHRLGQRLADGPRGSGCSRGCGDADNSCGSCGATPDSPQPIRIVRRP